MMAPPKQQTPLAGGVAEENTLTDALIVAERAAFDKRIATVRAQLALRGHAVHLLAEGGYLVVWRGLSRECRDLGELEAHARRVGGAA